MHTSLPPNRHAEERHQETLPRRELQKRIRSGGKRGVCTVRVVNAEEPRTRTEKFACTGLVGTARERSRSPSPAHEASPVEQEARSVTALKPFPCSNHGSDWTDRRAWSRNTAYSAGPESWQTYNPQIADPAGQRSPLR